jgi:hypothetical protein
MYFHKTAFLLKVHRSVERISVCMALCRMLQHTYILFWIWQRPSTEMQNACNFAYTSPTLIHVAVHVTCGIIFYFGHPDVLYILQNSCCGIRCSGILRNVTTFRKKLSVLFSGVKKSWTSCCVKSRRAEISFTSQGSLKSCVDTKYHEHN